MNTLELLRNTECSYYKRIKYTKSFKTVKLIDWIGGYSISNEKMIEYIRDTNKTDCKAAKKLKSDNLPAVTISAVFNEYRRIDLAEKLNPIIAIDIDKEDNLQVEDWEKLKEDVFNIDGVFFSSLSCRGEGIFVLVYIDLEKDFGKLFKALQDIFKEELGVTIDKNCKDITRLRFVSYDNNMKMKPEVNMFSKEAETEVMQEFIENKTEFNWDDDFTYKAIYYLIKEVGYRSNNYNDWLIDGFRLATFGKRGWVLYYLLSQLSQGFNERAFQEKWNECTRKTRFTKDSLSYYFGILKKILGKNWISKIDEYKV